ncbi:EGF-like repeat and discoidin I-like domain-containing protein 3 isoform X2 [Scyliorhinus canicula]|uniref:EGF-like repeat and discoidin I-like domain-containing protein 3 isoform X2 n=1 Tax=Scyliorhinus canicula TaxID=7830 RepID=UPI0018F2A3B3|nr:EGF-like repeat and discoidin I-like domain-containing protein 3 isoform X2 [Scyliorhinus canicula]
MQPRYQPKFCFAFLLTCTFALGSSEHYCQLLPCQNGGTCLYGVSSDPYYCICMDGFTGKDCTEVEQGSGAEKHTEYTLEDIRYNDVTRYSTPSGPCQPNPCQNDGLCELVSRRGDVFSEYTCRCPTGFQGIHCQTNVDDCSSEPCNNGGRCEDLDADFSCDCPSPHVGKSCQFTCENPLGMEGRSIDDHQISASSVHLGFLGLKRWRPELARLNNRGIVNAWSMATFDLNPWFQVNLLRRMRITGIVTQGALAVGTPEYIKLFKIAYSFDGVNFMIFRSRGGDKDKLFTGNRNNNEQKRNLIDPPIDAQYIRLIPVVCQRACTLRMELIGCELNGCSEPLGMKSRFIRNNQITASSTYKMWGIDVFTWAPCLARLDKQGKTNAWTAELSNKSQWLQIDLLMPKKVTGIITQGAKDFGVAQYVESFKIAYSDDRESWSIYQDGITRTDKVFQGNYDNYSHKKNIFDPPIDAQFIRILPQTWRERITLRVELLGCQE